MGCRSLVARPGMAGLLQSRDPSYSAGVRLQDLRVFDPATMAWTELSAATSGTPPSARSCFGFTSAGGKLYVHGGSGNSG